MRDDEPTVTSSLPPDHSARELQDLLLATEDVEKFLKQLIDTAVTSIGGGISAGITVARAGHPATVASSDEYAAQFDEVQYGPDQGPCLTAMRANKVVLIEDMAADERFSSYRLRALALGVRSSMSLPLTSEDHAIGALNLYARSTHAFDERAQAEARRFTDEASRAITLALRTAHNLEISDQLRAALVSRTVIDQTIGIIMGQNRCDAEVAFSVLRAASQHRNIKLHTVATEIITAVTKKPPGEVHPFQD